MNLEIDVKGLKEVEKRLKGLEAELGFKALRGGMMKASLGMFKAAKANAQKIRDSGALAAGMGRWSRKGNRDKNATKKTVVSLFIGVRSRNKKARALWAQHNDREMPKAIRHGHLTEFGTNDTPAQPYMRPAFKKEIKGFLRSFGAEVDKSITRYAKKS